MARPQLEDGYTRIANELLEALARAALPGPRHFQVLLAMIRKLYGFNRSEGRISSSQLAQLTGIDPGNVRRVLSELVAAGLLEADAKAGRVTVWRIQKDYEKWSDLGRRQPRSRTTQVVDDLGHVRHTTCVVDDLGTCVVDDLHKRKKDNSKTERDAREPEGARSGPKRRRPREQSPAPDGLAPAPLEAVRIWCQERFPALAARVPELVAACLDWHRSKGNLHADWSATARTWIRREAERMPAASPKPRAGPWSEWSPEAKRQAIREAREAEDEKARKAQR